MLRRVVKEVRVTVMKAVGPEPVEGTKVTEEPKQEEVKSEDKK